MNADRPRILDIGTRWLGASSDASLPCATLFVNGQHVGESRLALTKLDENAHRVCLFGHVQSHLGTIATMIELANPSEDAKRICQENDTAMRCLDATGIMFGPQVVAEVDPESGHWRVVVDGEAIAVGLVREEAVRIGHAIGLAEEA